MKKKRGKMQEVIKAVKNAKTAIILTHTDPDGDAIWSMTALYIVLKGMGKKVTMYCRDQIPEVYKFLPESGKVKNSLDQGKFDLAIAVDCGDSKRTGNGIDLRALGSTVINIDHHPDNAEFGDINLIEKISSVSEALFKLFKKMGIKITKNVATCLYTGIMTDTGNFRYDYTTAETFDVAAELARAGAKISRISMAVYEAKTLSSVRILGAAMYRMETSQSGKVAWTVLPKQLMDSLGAKSEDLTGLVDQIRTIKGVEVAVLFREEADGIKVNFRSKFTVNVSRIARQLGGGGHIRASGTVIQGTLEDVKEKVLAEVFKVIK
ncbi:MAG: bifunctional oligoribonuclease/PAP phosphatase NrnA [bacterium]